MTVEIATDACATRVSDAARLWMKRRIVPDPHWASSMHWLIDGYNLIRRDPALASREAESLEAGRVALCRLLAPAARVSGDRFTVVFDGRGAGGSGLGGAGVSVVFSSARETADRVLARLAVGGGAVVSNDREVRRAAIRSGAIAVSADEFLGRLRAGAASPALPIPSDMPPHMKDEDDETERRGPRKGNPRRLPRKQRAASRALGRLSHPKD